MYDLQQNKPEPLVPRNRRFGVKERTDAKGNVLLKAIPADLMSSLREIERNGSQAVAICFLNAFANSENEETIEALVAQHLPNLSISSSFQVCREIREYERTSTVVLNAAAKPLIEDYLGQIGPRVRRRLPSASILLMQSSGGSLTIDAACSYPARMITSGPAGGALAVQRLSKQARGQTLLGFDMGGTSTDISLIDKGNLRMTMEGGICQLPVLLPMIEINTIGAGAGSIAWLDTARGLHVGPQSAGAEPGPVAYDKGGTEPTVTDANFILGRLDPDRFADAGLLLNLSAARRILEKRIAAPLGMSVEQAAAGILRIANANMERALRLSSAEKGYDPRDISLVAFGGAGPMHAAALARETGIGTVVVPPHPGVFSSLGLVLSNIRHDFAQTRVLRVSEIVPDEISVIFHDLEQKATAALEADGVPDDHRAFHRSADLRYLGQAFEVNVPVADGPISVETISQTLDLFTERHLQLFAHKNPGRDIEFVSFRLAAIGVMNTPPVTLDKTTREGSTPKEYRPVYFDESKDFLKTAIYDRFVLTPESKFEGPAIIEQIDSTTVVHPGQSVKTDQFGNLLISTRTN